VSISQSRPTERLLARIRTLLDGVEIPEGAEIRRTYAGYWQRSAGAFSWTVEHEDLRYMIGGYEPVCELLKCPNLTAYRIYQCPTDIAVVCGCKGPKCEGLSGKRKGS